MLTPLHHHSLLCHPASPCPAILQIGASAAFDQDRQLHLRYVVSGEVEAIRWPQVQPSSPADDLWQHTCCEAFIGLTSESTYREFNFSPSNQWAAYQFNDYRVREPDFQAFVAPQINSLLLDRRFTLDAILPRALLPNGGELQLSLTLVIEAMDGSKSYWALAHDAAQPDFHLRSSFSLTLPRP